MAHNSKIVLGLAVFISAVATFIDACPETSVNLYLYTSKTGKDQPCKLTATSCPDFNKCGYNPNSPTVVIIHGWLGSYIGVCPEVIKAAYLEKILKDGVHINIIVVDYGPCASDYSKAVTWTREIGGAVAKIVQHLANSCGLNLKLVKCVGFSLGCHICGTFSAALTVKNKEIIGLDCAAPTISSYPPERKCDKGDADHVTCWHTSSKLLSITYAFCHADIFFNGAKDQPGCINNFWQSTTAGCDHNTACDIYAASVLNPCPVHKECATSDEALASKCTKTLTAVPYVGDEYHGLFGIYWADSYMCLKK